MNSESTTATWDNYFSTKAAWMSAITKDMLRPTEATRRARVRTSARAEAAYRAIRNDNTLTIGRGPRDL